MKEKSDSQYVQMELPFDFDRKDTSKCTSYNHSHWTFDRCLEAYNRCITYWEFRRKFSGAAAAVKRKGWRNLLIEKSTPKIELRKQEALEILKKCRTRKEVKTKYNKIYRLAKKNGWFNECDWLCVTEPLGNVYSVYVYEFKDNHSYVGLTLRPFVRDLSHRKDARSSVFQYHQQSGLPIPEMRILRSGLISHDAKVLEGEYVNEYKMRGWIVLNKARTGEKYSSLGCLSSWNRDKNINRKVKVREKTKRKIKPIVSVYEQGKGLIAEYQTLQELPISLYVELVNGICLFERKRSGGWYCKGELIYIVSYNAIISMGI